MADEKEDRWANDPPPGFRADGTSMIVPPGEPIKWPVVKIKLPGGVEVTEEEYEAAMAEASEEGDEPA